MGLPFQIFSSDDNTTNNLNQYVYVRKEINIIPYLRALQNKPPVVLIY
jgi:hypothetical protein